VLTSLFYRSAVSQRCATQRCAALTSLYRCAALTSAARCANFTSAGGPVQTARDVFPTVHFSTSSIKQLTEIYILEEVSKTMNS